MPNQMTDNIRFVVLASIILFFLFVLGTKIWRGIISRKATKWPCVEGTIESGKLEHVAGNRRGPEVILPVFAFSYRVGTAYYSGRFALLPYITDPFVSDSSFVEHMIGRKVQVNHDPLKPEVWFIADKLIEGCKVEQKFSGNWIDYSPPD